MREHQELVFISQGGMVQRTGVRGISQQGRSAQGVRVMNIKRRRPRVSAVALVVESEPDDAPTAPDDDGARAPDAATADRRRGTGDGAAGGRLGEDAADGAGRGRRAGRRPATADAA